MIRLGSLIVAVCAFAISCSPGPRATRQSSFSITSLRLLDEFRVPHKPVVNGTTLGGLSGIDYNPAANEYYLVCDDRSALNQARFYTARVKIDANGIDTVIFTNMTYLRQPDGTLYPSTQEDPFHTPDPEALRYNRLLKAFVWSSEGERVVNAQRTVLVNPFLHIMDATGKYLDSFALPPALQMTAGQQGPRQNGVLESLAFTSDHAQMYAAVEEPLYQDGPRAGLTPSKAWVRIFKYDVATRKAVAQYAYALDPVAHPPQPEGSFMVNGIPDILCVDDKRLLVVERSYSTGRAACTIKLFIAELDGAVDISSVAALNGNTTAIPLRKRLLLNMDELGRYTDNIEGVTFGPTLPNGHRTLLFVSDDNFAAGQVTQFLLFEVVP